MKIRSEVIFQEYPESEEVQKVRRDSVTRDLFSAFAQEMKKLDKYVTTIDITTCCHGMQKEELIFVEAFVLNQGTMNKIALFMRENCRSLRQEQLKEFWDIFKNQ